MSWKKYFRSVAPTSSSSNQLSPSTDGAAIGTNSKFSSYLPEVYAGHPHRIQRYYQYDDMDKDSDINAALDTIADFATQSEEQNDTPFEIVYNGEANETEIKLLKAAMDKWCKLNDFRSKLWFMFRNTIKNGDSFFLRDPETFEWLWIDHFMVEMVKVDETDGKEPDEYIIRGLDYNKQAKFGSIAADPSQYRMPLGAANIGGSRPSSSPASGPTVFALSGSTADQRQRRQLSGQNDQLYVVDAKSVIHLSLSVGMDINWPFGQSILEPIFKTYKQKELLEDAIIIYRVSRAPERRIFYIDTGLMPPARAKAHIEQMKNEIHQRRIPNRSGGGSSILDAAFNPLSTMDDYFFSVGCFRLNTGVPLLDGRTLTFAEIINEFNIGKVNYVYSMNKNTHEFEPGKITWAGLTRKNAEMVRVTLDNGEYADCTPDHRFITRNGCEVHAEDLQPGDSLMPLYRFASFTGKKQKTAKCERYLSNATGKRKFTHLAVCPKPPGRDFVVHHIDFNEQNNSPNNLVVMSWKDHARLSKALQDAITSDAEKHADSLRNLNNARVMTFTPDMFARLVHFYSRGFQTFNEIGSVLSDDETFRNLFSAANANTKMNEGSGEKLSRLMLSRIVQQGGYNSWRDFRASSTNNHKVVSVERLVEREDTADITVESASDSHIFALSIGVYVHNSEGRGSRVETLPGGECFALDTRIVLLDGRSLPLQEIIAEFEQGKQLWTYSCNPETGAVVPGMINWAGVTRKNAQMVKLTLDNGKTVTVTPDHKFPVQGRGVVEARDLTPEDSLFPFETRRQVIKEGRTKDYLQVFDSSTKNWVYVHRLVADYFKGHQLVKKTVFDGAYQDASKTTVHHINFDRFNNNPENLTWVNHKDHYKYHTATLNENYGHLAREGLMRFFASLTEEQKQVRNQHMSDKIKASIARKTESEMAEFIAQSTANLKNGHATERQLWLLQNDHSDFVFAVRHLNAMLENRGTTWKAVRDKAIAGQKPRMTKTLKTDIKVIQDVALHFKAGAVSLPDMIQSLNSDAGFIEHLASLNQKRHHLGKADQISYTQLVSILQDNGYDSWKAFKAAGANFNHRIVSIEWLDQKQNTGTVTIDGAEIFHDYHTLALDVGIYSQNSLGEISDLSFFSKKLARGLRIPPSYLSIGEDQNAPIAFNDGKLGAALIQEFRFNKYCMRIQSLLSPVFDKEFRAFLDRSGIEIDPNLFSVRFNPPQNFTKYRQIELDTQQVGVYTQLAENKRLSERFKLKRFLNLTDDEVLENETMWAEENAAKIKKSTGETPADDTGDQGLSTVGVRSPGMDMDMGEPPAEGGEDMAGGVPPEGGDAGMASAAGGAPPAAGGAGAPGGAPPG